MTEVLTCRDVLARVYRDPRPFLAKEGVSFLKAISIRQPFAFLLAAGIKSHETRSFRTHHRGWLLIHSSSVLEENLSAALKIQLDKAFSGWEERWSRGALVGAVRIDRVEPTGLAAQMLTPSQLLYGDYSPGRWAWHAQKSYMFGEPIPCRGALGVFEVRDELIAERQPIAWEKFNEGR